MAPRFLADEDLRHSIVYGVRAWDSRIEFATLLEWGFDGLPDAAVLEVAWERQWLVVSHDVNTMIRAAKVRMAEGDQIHGLFVVPQNKPDRPIVDSLLAVWTCSEFAEWRNRIEYLPY